MLFLQRASAIVFSILITLMEAYRSQLYCVNSFVALLLQANWPDKLAHDWPK